MQNEENLYRARVDYLKDASHKLILINFIASSGTRASSERYIPCIKDLSAATDDIS